MNHNPMLSLLGVFSGFVLIGGAFFFTSQRRYEHNEPEISGQAVRCFPGTLLGMVTFAGLLAILLSAIGLSVIQAIHIDTSGGWGGKAGLYLVWAFGGAPICIPFSSLSSLFVGSRVSRSIWKQDSADSSAE